MLEPNPLITIITIAYNCADCIEKTILSVISQSFTDYEYIIIDGGSNDGTCDIIKKYEKSITFWSSKRDRGISDAFNIGIKRASGTYINLLNAGDIYLDEYILQKIEPHLVTPIVNFRYYLKHLGLFSLPVNPDAKFEERALLGHQATFVHKDVYDSFGGYALSYKIRMDYDFFLRTLPHVELKVVDLFVVDYNAGVSGSWRNKFRFEAEGLIAIYLNLRKNDFYITRVLIVPFYRIGLNLLKNIIKSIFPFLKRKPEPEF